MLSQDDVVSLRLMLGVNSELDRGDKVMKHSMSAYYNFYANGARQHNDFPNQMSMYAFNGRHGLGNGQEQAILAAHFQHRQVVLCSTRAIKEGKA